MGVYGLNATVNFWVSGKKTHQKLIFIMHINKGLDHYQLKNLGLHQIFLNLTRESGFNLRLLLTK